jgi:hypothetical protein
MRVPAVFATVAMLGSAARAWVTEAPPRTRFGRALGLWFLSSSSDGRFENSDCSLRVLPDLSSEFDERCVVRFSCSRYVQPAVQVNQCLEGVASRVADKNYAVRWHDTVARECSILGISMDLSWIPFLPQPKGKLRRICFRVLGPDTLRLSYDRNVNVLSRTNVSEKGSSAMRIETFLMLQVLASAYTALVHLAISGYGADR